MTRITNFIAIFKLLEGQSNLFDENTLNVFDINNIETITVLQFR